MRGEDRVIYACEEVTAAGACGRPGVVRLEGIVCCEECANDRGQDCPSFAIEDLPKHVRVATRVARALAFFGVTVGRVEEPGRWKGFPFVVESALRVWELKEALQRFDREAAYDVDWAAALQRAEREEDFSLALQATFDAVTERLYFEPLGEVLTPIFALLPRARRET